MLPSPLIVFTDAHAWDPRYVTVQERLSRKKHDAGDVADLVFHALESTGSSLDDVELVVQVNIL
jgi:hypothetical protein